MTWLAISAPIWGALLAPGLLFGLLVLFYAYWLYRSLSVAIGALVVSGRLRSAEQRSWIAEGSARPGWDRLHHLVLVPTYGEPVEVLAKTLDHLASQDFPGERIHVVLAFEAREPKARDRWRQIQEQFRGTFGNLWATFHKDRPNEVPGKSANLAHAGRWARAELVDRLGVRVEDVLVTVCDADSRLHPKYLSALAATALADRDLRFHLYQPAIFLYGNIWRLPIVARVANGIYTTIELAKLALPYRLVPQSTYSVPLRTVVEVGYWDIDVIPDDSRIFFKLFFALGGRVKVMPIYLPCVCDAAEGRTFWGTIASQYRQARRWAWGVSDVPYVVQEVWRHGEIALPMRLLRFASFAADHFLWVTHWFLIVLGSNLTPLLAPAFFGSAEGRLLSAIAGGLIALSSPCLLVVAFSDLRLRPPHPRRSALQVGIGELLALLLLPLATLVLTVLPALDAHTRLLVGRPLAYQVTAKLAGAGQEADSDRGALWSDEPSSAKV